MGVSEISYRLMSMQFVKQHGEVKIVSARVPQLAAHFKMEQYSVRNLTD